MSLNEILDIVMVLAGVIGLGVLFFFYFTNAKVRGYIDLGLKYLPMVLTFAQKIVKDKKGVFDTYDSLQLLARVSERIKTTIADPANRSFEDVQDEVFDIVRDELAQYKNLPGTPDLSDPAIQMQVKVVFQSIVRALGEDSARNDS